MPGPVVTTATASAPSAPQSVESGKLFVAGMTASGPVGVPVRITSLSDFEDVFGVAQSYSYVHQTLNTYFSEGGATAYISRVVGPNAASATYTWVDRAGSPVNTLKFSAVNPGAWGNSLSVTVAAGAGSTIDVSVVLSGVTVQVVNATTIADVVAGFVGSPYVTVVDQASLTSAPNNLPATGTHALIGGDDDHSGVLATHYETALTAFNIELGSGAVCIPGVGSTVHAMLVTHAEATNRIALLSLVSGADKTAHIAAAAGVGSEYAGLFGPWVVITVNGVNQTIPPEGYVAAVRNRAYTRVGSWRVPAGANSIARFVTGLATTWNRADGDILDTAKVSVIRTIAGTTRLYGWKSLSTSPEYTLLNIRDLLNDIVTTIDFELEEFVFEPIDAKGHLLSNVNAKIAGILETIHLAGGLFDKFDSAGKLVDPGYTVNTGNTVNTLTTLSNNEVHAEVGIRPSPSAATIYVTITKVGLLSNLV